jgi:hypothetical protein
MCIAHIYSINTDGTHVKKLTTGFRKAYYGQICPGDENLMLFRGDEEKSDIFIRNLVTGETRQLTHHNEANK